MGASGGGCSAGASEGKGGKDAGLRGRGVVGGGHGGVGCCGGRAKEVRSATKKGIEAAKKNLMRVPMHGTTIPHAIVGHFGAGSVLREADLALKKPGTGLGPERLPELVGRTLARALAADESIQEADLLAPVSVGV